MRSVQGQESMKLLFRLITGSDGMLEDMRIRRDVEWLVMRRCNVG